MSGRTYGPGLIVWVAESGLRFKEPPEQNHGFGLMARTAQPTLAVKELADRKLG